MAPQKTPHKDGEEEEGEKCENAIIVEYYYGKVMHDVEKNKWKCKACGKFCTWVGSTAGYTNPMRHIVGQHSDYRQKALGEAPGGSPVGAASASTTPKGTKVYRQLTIEQMAGAAQPIAPKSANLYGWCDWVVMDELEICFVDKERTRMYTDLQPICSKTLKKYVFRLSKLVGTKITDMARAADHFAFVFDGWSVGTTHYVGVYISLNPAEETVPKSPPRVYLLVCSPMGDETSFTSEMHVEFLEAVMEHYHLERSKLVCLIGDNAKVNKKTARLMKLPLLGCRSHRFNLAVESYLAQFLSDELHETRTLMNAIRLSLKAGAELRKETHLKPLSDNKTRWLGKMEMLERLDVLMPHLKKLFEQATGWKASISKLLPTHLCCNAIMQHRRLLRLFKKVTLKLQNPTTTLAQAQNYFDRLMQEMGDEAKDLCLQYLSLQEGNETIMHDPVFESALIKIQAGRELELTNEEKAKVQSLLKPNYAPDEDDANNGGDGEDEEADFSFIEESDKSLLEAQQGTKYVATEFCLPTSNAVERLFSLTGRILGNHRQNMAPDTLEALVFLKQNRDLWDVYDVQTASTGWNEFLQEHRHKAQHFSYTAFTEAAGPADEWGDFLTENSRTERQSVYSNVQLAADQIQTDDDDDDDDESGTPDKESTPASAANAQTSRTPASSATSTKGRGRRKSATSSSKTRTSTKKRKAGGVARRAIASSSKRPKPGEKEKPLDIADSDDEDEHPDCDWEDGMSDSDDNGGKQLAKKADSGPESESDE